MTEATTNEQLVTIKDPVRGTEIQVTPEIQTLIGHMISTERRITREKADAEYAPLLKDATEYKNVNAGLIAELEKVKTGTQTADEAAQEKYSQSLQKIEEEKKGLMEQVSAWQSRYQADKIRNDVYSAFGGVVLANPGQACVLFMTEGNAKIVPVFGSDGKETGEYQTIMKLSITDGEKVVEETGTPKELFPKWINQKKNAHHVLSSLQSGAGTYKGLNGSDNKAQVLDMKPSDRANLGNK